MTDPKDVQKAQEKVLGEVQSGDEPASGVEGPGTADQPYDQGNQPEQATAPTQEEPAAGRQGEGTADKPYDQGNQPEQKSMNIIDQLSRTKTKDEIAQKKARKQSTIEATTSPHTSKPNGVPATPTIITEDRGRSNTDSVTASSAPEDVDTKKLAPKPSQQAERSVSPGQLADGSHVKCSGDMGQSYTPPSTLGKIGRKLHIG